MRGTLSLPHDSGCCWPRGYVTRPALRGWSGTQGLPGLACVNAGPRCRTPRKGRLLGLGWSMAGTVVVIVAAIAARFVTLAGCGLDPLIEVGASPVVIFQLQNIDSRQPEQLACIDIDGFALGLPCRHAFSTCS